jgi:hypothetical protein
MPERDPIREVESILIRLCSVALTLAAVISLVSHEWAPLLKVAGNGVELVGGLAVVLAIILARSAGRR